MNKYLFWVLATMIGGVGIYFFIQNDLPWAVANLALFVKVYLGLKLLTIAQGIYFLNRMRRLHKLTPSGIFSISALLFVYGGITFVSIFSFTMLASLFASKEFEARMFTKLDQKLQLVLERAG